MSIKPVQKLLIDLSAFLVAKCRIPYKIRQFYYNILIHLINLTSLF
ncbi:hypothetical protein DESC_190036 [Desulfosarcina cetonica]|nr:hypothetical protein DESC_190036 [Desulfosarcina cetonica]